MCDNLSIFCVILNRCTQNEGNDAGYKIYSVLNVYALINLRQPKKGRNLKCIN